MSRRVTTYILVLFTVGMVAFLTSLPTFQIQNLIIILVLWLITSILDINDVELPNGTIFTGATIFTFVVLALFGIAEAMVLELLVVLTAAVYFKSVPIKTLFNIGQYLLSVFIAGVIYNHFATTMNEITIILILFMTIIIKYITNIAFLSVIMSSLMGKKYWITFIEMLIDAILPFVVTLLFSARLIFIYDEQQVAQFWIETAFIFIFFLTLRYSFRMFIKLRKTYLTTIESLTQVTEKRHLQNDGHAIRVGRVARTLAESMKLPQEDIDQIHYAALLHDLGKVQLKETVLRKKGPLTIEEEAQYRRHVDYGAAMIRGISGLERAADYVYFHHESWDGKGFPEGKIGETIPLGSRIIATANAFDHLFMNTKTKSPASEFEKLSNHKLDPSLVKLTLSLMDTLTDVVTTESEVTEEVQQAEERVMSEARKNVYQSELLNRFGASLIVTYDGITFRDEDDREVNVPDIEAALRLIASVKGKKSGGRELIEDKASATIYDVYCFDSGQSTKMIYFDVTHVLDYEKNQENQVKSLYRDVIYSVTDGKLQLIDEHELKGFTASDAALHIPIMKKGDVKVCRQAVEEFLSDFSLPDKKRFDTLLCVSEVVTNVIKHADEGEMRVYRLDKAFRIVVQDNGNGIDLTDLPKSTLLKGYSTKISLGHGFSLLLKLMDKIKMNTGPKGTTIVMDIQIQ